jgi:hypothetical protein
MTCERRYTESAISEMHAIEQLADLRRFIDDELKKPESSAYFSPRIGLMMVKLFLDSKASYSRCDNPPAKGE